jgi:tRNA-specific 2-thiouridylase
MKGLKKYPIGWWSEVTIRNVLANEAYTGRWYCGKNQTIKLDVANLRTGKPKVRQIKRAKEEWYPIEIPRIVSDEQHKKAFLQARKNLMFAKRCTKQTYLLQGLIRCAKDGLRYRGHQEKSDVIYYYCKSRANNTPQENCHSPYLRADQIEPMVWDTVKSILENPEEVFNTFRDESILNEERAKSIEGRLDYISDAIKKLEVAKKRITEAFKAEAMTLPEFRKEKTDIELSEEKLISERDALMMKLNVQHDVSAKIDLFKETCHKFLSKINDPKIVTERLKKDIIKLIIDEVVIEGESVKIFATIPLPNKIHEREMDKTDIPGTFNAGATLGPVNETNMARIWNKHKQSNTPLKRKVFVGLSGGVDSSVAAYLLKNEGFDVTGVHLRCWNREGCDVREAEDARRVAEKMDIPFYVFNLEKEYREKVVEYMVQGYARGETPNPDVMCNKEIKFGLFLEKALGLGADYVATGHYVKIKKSKLKNEYGLFKAKDNNKDQSYFLWTLTQKQLSHCLFPVGDYLKPEVRKIAKKAGLSTAGKKDSQGICFLGKVTLPEFLSEYLPAKKGNILDAGGKVLGNHKGVQFYTIGQRHGICVPGKKPYYVANKDIKSNSLVIAEGEDKALYKKEVELTDVNFINKDYFSDSHGGAKKVFVRVRYRQPLFEAILIEKMNESGIMGYFIVFDKPQKFIAKGQSAVFYSKKGEMLGGGIIKVSA